MTSELIAEINAERGRQDAKHPALPRYLLNPEYEPKPSDIEASLIWRRKDNDALEAKGEHSWFGIIGEEYREIFTAKTKAERRTEAIQTIATLVRMLENDTF